jgi:ubiquinone/menaquinone biosynthesis C-methylase UbiE
MNRPEPKQKVYDFWNDASCGEALYLSTETREGFEYQLKRRYELEPFIPTFAKFDLARGLKVLEIGVGLGADHQKFAEAGADLYGIDLTDRAIEHTRNRLACFGLQSTLNVGDAENLAFADDSFDLVYSWGVLHHSPNTARAITECWRVLKPGGVARIMIYHTWSMVGLMLWFRYGLLAFKPFTGMKEIYSKYLESPGTKAYNFDEAKVLFKGFVDVNIRTVMTHADLLESEVGQRYRGSLLSIARKVWPRWLIRRLFPNAGLFMLIEARK